MTAIVTIVLVDDHQILRQGLRNLLEDEPDFRVIGEAASAAEGIALTEKLRPDIVISDLIMNGLDGIDLTREVRTRSPNTRVVILTMYDDAGYVARATEEGAKGYVLKGSGIEELIAAIREVLAGGTYLARKIR